MYPPEQNITINMYGVTINVVLNGGKTHLDKMKINLNYHYIEGMITFVIFFSLWMR
jgi:hypothetical protein